MATTTMASMTVARLLAVTFALLGSVAGPWLAQACFIQGHDSGVCENPEDFELRMPFCKNQVRYRACVPRFQELFANHTTRGKDDWIANTFTSIVEQRKRWETDENLQDLGITETGEPGEIVIRFFENPECEQAYKNFFCWINFPRCDEVDASLILCRSVCENFFDACEYDSDMWRCGDPAFYGGAEPEVDDILDEEGLPIYWRTQFPGQPFRDYLADDEDNPIPVCTPSLKGAAASISPGGLLSSAVAAVATSLIVAAAAHEHVADAVRW